MGTPSKVAALLIIMVVLLILHGRLTVATWCVVRSDASREALQTALDYACGAGADCAPLQPSGLCFLPNTIQAHASYAFNSYYMRRSMAPGSCDFSGTATVAKTDPSYGSCVYPSSPSTAGGTTPVSGFTPPVPPFNGGLRPIGNGMVPTLDTPLASNALRISTILHLNTTTTTTFILFFFFIFQIINILSA